MMVARREFTRRDDKMSAATYRVAIEPPSIDLKLPPSIASPVARQERNRGVIAYLGGIGVEKKCRQLAQ